MAATGNDAALPFPLRTLALSLVALALLVAGRASGAAPDPRAEGPPGTRPSSSIHPTTPQLLSRIDASLASAARFLLRKQSGDGAWRSETYGALREGPSVTPHVLSALFFLPQGGEAVRPAFRRGAGYLMGLIREDGTIDAGPRGLMFPVFAAASASRVVALDSTGAVRRRAQAAWLAVVRARQLNESLGWTPADPEYGGWGFSIHPPRRPKTGEMRGRFFSSNLVATLFGIAALRSSRVPPSDPSYRQALVFVRRCQNFAADPSRADPRFDDGGFFFAPDDALQNKAGVAGKDRHGRVRYHSYGSMTADGLRALIRCGLPATHPRVVAARKWLERHFSATRHPGNFVPLREVQRQATYNYWCWAVAHAFLALHIREIDTADGKVRWAEPLARELIRRQKPDGSWTNRYTDAKEDDPLVAVPFAASALAICRGVVSGEHRSLGRPCAK